jgi:hypothetical protein
MMKLNASIVIALFVLLLGAPPRAAAQTESVAQVEAQRPPPRYVRRPIVIHPGQLLYRRCVDWYELQNRPSGTVLFPQMRCWWVRG